MQVQWYPGHMTKAKRAMKEDMKLVDLVVEILDARAPLSSRNPDIDELSGKKARLVLLNKADLADAKANIMWERYFLEQGCITAKVDARKRSDMKPVQNAIREACREKTERDRKRGIKNRPVRAMVVGIPNVGKSTFINSFAGRACAKTGNRPGVTRGNQWIRLSKEVELLDTPGILWPKFEDEQVGIKLALLGSVKDEILGMEELSLELLGRLKEWYPQTLKLRYQLTAAEGKEGPAHMLMEIARFRNCVLKGNELDLEKAARLVIDDFRSGRLGAITLEFPDQEQG